MHRKTSPTNAVTRSAGTSSWAAPDTVTDRSDDLPRAAAKRVTDTPSHLRAVRGTNGDMRVWTGADGASGLFFSFVSFCVSPFVGAREVVA